MNRYRIFFLSLLLGVLLNPLTSHGQCRDKTTWDNAWTSCTPAASPNPNRGAGHWLLYDLGYEYSLESLHVWNANKAGETTKGVKIMAVDYSNDGQRWTEWGNVNLAEAGGTDYYSGETAADFGMIQARYVLLTAVENHGDPQCNSLHEVSFKLRSGPVTQGNDMWVYPNPATEWINVAFEGAERENLQLEVVNMLGQRLHSEMYLASTGPQKVELNIEEMRPGIYFVRVRRLTGEMVGRSKFVVSR
ncbi:MAG: T9SS type A sorting domain-containing protein [Bacteroidota bacterium]